MEEIYYWQAYFDVETFTFIVVGSLLEEINFFKIFKLISFNYLETILIIIDAFYYFY